MRIHSYLRHALLGCLLFAGCAQPVEIESKDSPVQPTCVLTDPTPTPVSTIPVPTDKEAVAAAGGEFCCTGAGCHPMAEVVAEIEDGDLCESGDMVESNATVLTAKDIVASGKKVFVGGDQVDAIYGGCPLPDPPTTNPTCGGGTLVLEVEATDKNVIAFAKDGTPTVYAVPPGATSVRVDQADLLSLAFLIVPGGAWANTAKPVRFNGLLRYLDYQTDWAVLPTGKSAATAGRTCRGTKC